MIIDQKIMQRYGLTDSDLQTTFGMYVPEKLTPNQFFLKQGGVSDRIGFVVSGLLRAFFYDVDANEITTQFYPKGSLIISFDSFNNQVPSKENIIAIEDSELMVINYQKQKELYQLVPAWNQICKDLADLISQSMIARSVQFQTLTATERYQQFCKEYPDVVKKAPVGHIASYLGIDIATLSRIRKKI